MSKFIISTLHWLFSEERISDVESAGIKEVISKVRDGIVFVGKYADRAEVVPQNLFNILQRDMRKIEESIIKLSLKDYKSSLDHLQASLILINSANVDKLNFKADRNKSIQSISLFKQQSFIENYKKGGLIIPKKAIELASLAYENATKSFYDGNLSIKKRVKCASVRLFSILIENYQADSTVIHDLWAHVIRQLYADADFQKVLKYMTSINMVMRIGDIGGKNFEQIALFVKDVSKAIGFYFPSVQLRQLLFSETIYSNDSQRIAQLERKYQLSALNRSFPIPTDTYIRIAVSTLNNCLYLTKHQRRSYRFEFQMTANFHCHKIVVISTGNKCGEICYNGNNNTIMLQHNGFPKSWHIFDSEPPSKLVTKLSLASALKLNLNRYRIGITKSGTAFFAKERMKIYCKYKAIKSESKNDKPDAKMSKSSHRKNQPSSLFEKIKLKKKLHLEESPPDIEFKPATVSFRISTDGTKKSLKKIQLSTALCFDSYRYITKSRKYKNYITSLAVADDLVDGNNVYFAFTSDVGLTAGIIDRLTGSLISVQRMFQKKHCLETLMQHNIRCCADEFGNLVISMNQKGVFLFKQPWHQVSNCYHISDQNLNKILGLACAQGQIYVLTSNEIHIYDYLPTFQYYNKKRFGLQSIFN